MLKLTRKVFNRDGSIRKIVNSDGSRRYWLEGVETDHDYYWHAIALKFQSRKRILPRVQDLMALRDTLTRNSQTGPSGFILEEPDYVSRRRFTPISAIQTAGLVSVELPEGVPGYPVGSPLCIADNGGIVVWTPEMHKSIIGMVRDSFGGSAVIQLDTSVAVVTADTNGNNYIRELIDLH